MSTVVVGGGGPRPQARIVQISDVDAQPGTDFGPKAQYAIFDGNECIALFFKLSHAKAMLPVIHSGE